MRDMRLAQAVWAGRAESVSGCDRHGSGRSTAVPSTPQKTNESLNSVSFITDRDGSTAVPSTTVRDVTGTDYEPRKLLCV